MSKRELDPDLGEAGTISSSMGDINYQYDEENNNYVVDIEFARGGSAEYVLDSETISELDAKGGAFYNSSIRGQM
jgi:hypothetical protein